MTKEPKNRINIASTEDLLQVSDACRKMLEATGCDYMVSLFPCKDGSEEIARDSVTIRNLVGHFNSVAEQTAERLGVSRETALRHLADVGTMTKQSINLD